MVIELEKIIKLNEGVIKFYTDNHFKYLQIDKNDKYQQMIVKLKP